ncbi:helix-turn-helix transcriptional regulator [Cellulosilyticum lentocellum]|uniref:Helix-turn-helix domain protein n=1 Tax=Cellulosilyticum lentocellum (strain ATCC 49066 / DSM 5427 / NCIMB 11756 / RHM5) TaxID=642492 RepID=F2JQ48_CELLD|nr:helix-turn-helix transcriptional regulator [Cellulosilyticum lentocellum]ADZ82596.1 helix-turn-helix domain protein [Cellulosilyticum lentocellum DSM 5427]
MNVNVEKLKSLIYNNGFTYTDLSNVSGVSRTSINRIVNNGFIPRPSTVGKLCKALNCKVEDLLKEDR